MRNAIILIIVTILLVAGSLFVKNRMSSTNQPAGQQEILPTNTTTGYIEPRGTATTTGSQAVAPTTTTAPKPAMTKEGSYIIYYENSGFKPSTLTIKVGKGVRFINNSTRTMLVYSTNQKEAVYASLNESKSVGKGGIYNYVFTTPGTYGYYNFNNPRDIGVIIVK